MPDIFRPIYRELGQSEKDHISILKDKAGELHDLLAIDGTQNGQREMALARTKLEEAVMWAVKAITS